jgi:hypothetical protein
MAIMDQSEFNRERGMSLKASGMALAAANRTEQLAYAREVAVSIATDRADRLCWADLVQERMYAEGISLGNAAGSIFVGAFWQPTGRYRKSARVSNHSRVQREWRLAE